jgi:hypothetical protein
MSFALPNGTWTLSDGAFPAWFNYSLEFYTGSGGNGMHWLEIDNWEQIGGICGFNHDHQTIANNNSHEASGYPTSSNGSPGPSTSQQGTRYNIHGTLYIPSTLNNGTGFIARYWNNVQISTQYLSWTTGQNYDEGKNLHQIYFLKASYDDSPGQPVGPLNVDWVKVWAASLSAIVRA